MNYIIGRVIRESYEKEGKTYPTLIMDVRTISVRKKFAISVNKYKFPDKNVDGTPVAGKENEPDYHIWHNFSGRGESIPSVIVGSIVNAVGQGGTAYKRAVLFDPFLGPYEISFALFEANGDGDVLYNVVAEPFRSGGGARRDVPVVTENISKE